MKLFTQAIAAFIFSSIVFSSANAQVKPIASLSVIAPTNQLSAIAVNNAVAINWPTNPAFTTSDLVIERSFNNADFKAICYVFAAEDASFTEALTHYKARSAELNGKSTAYYRIKKTDKDNVVTYSDLMTVSLK